MKKKPSCSLCSNGFTLVELLIAIMVVIILSGLVLTLVNPNRQRMLAENGVKRGVMAKVVDVLETYATSEGGTYPATADFCSATSRLTTTYMSECPDGEPNGADYVYWSNGTNFGLVVAKTSDTISCYKYWSEWRQLRECTGCSAQNNLCT